MNEYTSTTNQQDLLKNNTVKISASFEGISDITNGSGIIYKTSSNSKYDYILTALHCIFGERNGNKYKNEKILKEISVKRKNDDNGNKYDESNITKHNVIAIHSIDIAILLLEKDVINCIREIILGDGIYNGKLISNGFPNFSDEDPYDFHHYTKVNYNSDAHFKIECKSSLSSYNSKEKLSGYSGSGLLIKDKPILIGLITEITDEDGLANGFVAKKLMADKLNFYLAKENSELEGFKSTQNSDSITVDDNNNIVDYKKININGIELNIWRAIKRLKQDLRDDWFQDPLDFKFWFPQEFVLKRIKKFAQIIEKSYKPTSPAKHYVIPKSGFSTRPCIETSLIDRVIYQAYIDKLSENLDIALDNRIYSFRINSGKNNNKYLFHFSIEQWMKYVYQTKSELSVNAPFLVVADITNFFENIQIGLLISELDNIIHDYFRSDDKLEKELKCITNNLKILITKWNENLINKEFGIPQNRDASSFLANIFLRKIDNTMINELGYNCYYRYMDDIRIVCNTEAESRKAVSDLSKALRLNGLNLNSSKTKILCFNQETDRKQIEEYLPNSLLQLEQISSLLKTKRKREVQKAVHMTFSLFKNTIADDNDEESFLKKRKISFCIGKLQQFARIPGLKQSLDYRIVIDYVLKQLVDQPWLTASFIQLLRAIDKTYFKNEDFIIIQDILLDKYRNIYEGQTYYLWLFLAYTKYKEKKLIDYAKERVNLPNQDNQADTAGAYLYLASIDWRKYSSMMLKTLNHGNIGDNYFLQKNVIVALRMINPNKIEKKRILKDLKGFHEKLYKRNKEVFVADLPDLKISDVIKDSPALISL